MRTAFRIIIGSILALSLLIGISLTYFYFFIWKKPLLVNSPQKELYIPTNASLKTVLDSIQDWPINMDTASFALLARTKKLDLNVRPGKYILEPDMNVNQFINLLRAGRQTPVRVTFSYVSTFPELAGKIASFIEADSLSLLQEMTNLDRTWPDGISSENNRGVFIPNTYEMYWNSSASDFIERMIIEYHRFWSEARREKARNIGLTPREVIILASIVERETVKNDEMPKVAGLYLNRIRKGWKLQSDPTVIFSIQQSDPLFAPRRVLYQDLEFDSPYNTYKYHGLPPGPISFPSTSALRAVLNAEQHEYMYMCANPDSPGYHSFARNDREHQINKAKYVQWLQKQGIRR